MNEWCVGKTLNYLLILILRLLDKALVDSKQPRCLSVTFIGKPPSELKRMLETSESNFKNTNC